MLRVQAIDHTTHVLSLTYNRSAPIIFNTYQAYLKGSFQRLAEDMERARREKYVFAAKLVSETCCAHAVTCDSARTGAAEQCHCMACSLHGGSTWLQSSW
jgi:hypothetical protein